MEKSRQRPQFQLRSRTRSDLLQKFINDVTCRERHLTDDVSRAEKTAKQLRSELASEQNYSNRVRQERDEAKNKFAAILKDVAAIRADRSKTQEELTKLHRDLEESTHKVTEMEALVAEATRRKNQELFARDEKVKKRTAFFQPSTHLCLSISLRARTQKYNN